MCGLIFGSICLIALVKVLRRGCGRGRCGGGGCGGGGCCGGGRNSKNASSPSSAVPPPSSPSSSIFGERPVDVACPVESPSVDEAETPPIGVTLGLLPGGVADAGISAAIEIAGSIEVG